MNDKVVQAFPGLPENPLQIEKVTRTPFYCQHEAIRINSHERTVHCATCNAALDPFDFLLNSAATLRRAWENHKSASTMVAELNDRVMFLKKEEKRLRAQVKRLQDKTGEVVQYRGEVL